VRATTVTTTFMMIRMVTNMTATVTARVR